MKNFTYQTLFKKVFFVVFTTVFCVGANLYAQTTDRTTVTKHTTLEPVIDGKMDPIWMYADSAKIDTTGSHWGPGLSNPDDFVASVKTLWNGNNLFALVKVTDDELKRTNAWASGDYFEISMDVNNLDATDYSTSGHFWAIRPGWTKENSFFGRQAGQMSGMDWIPADIEFFSKVDSVEVGGYWTYYTTLEIKFPLVDLGLVNDLTDGSIVGLDFRIQDLDNDGTSVWCYDGSSGWDKPISCGSFQMSANEAIPATDRTTVTKHTTLEPVVDGKMDPIWLYADSAKIDTTGSHWGPGLSNPDDFVASVKTLWNGNNLFALVKVTDDELKRTNAWASGDYFEISMDVNNLDATDYSTSGHFWAIRPGWTKENSFFGRQTGQMSGMDWTPADIEFASIVDSVEIGGYWTYYTTLEIKFPLNDLGLANDLTSGSIVGLDFRIQDLDNDGTSVWCYDGSSGWDKPVSCGSFIMSAETVVTSAKLINNIINDIIIYPNPTTDYINVATSNELKNIYVLDLMGKTVLEHTSDGAGVQKINFSHLKSGIYFIKAVSKGNTLSVTKVIKN